MKNFDHFDLDLEKAETQIEELRQLLAQDGPIPEAGDDGLLNFFRSRRDVLGLLARVDLGVSSPNVVAEELDLEGFFRTDFAVGDTKRGDYLLIELEPADDNVFFRNGKKSKRDWHRRLNVGYSQLVDWFWLLSDVEHSKTLRDQFPNFHDFTGMLVIGRDRYLDKQELARLDWRAMNSKINGRAILFMTYDGLFRRVRDEADALRRYGRK